ncbi:MAG: adenylate kinase [Paludibacteraceae bacterium]|nr:adenylate kinase [Paludibacteraceae bacterium]
MLNIIMCGAPGSGKGTQSQLMVNKYRLAHLSTGDLLRHEVATGSELGRMIESYTSKGNLIPDELMVSILAKHIDSLPSDTPGLILDGFPRTVAQAEALEQMLTQRGTQTDLLIDLDVAHDELIGRLLNRGKTSGRSDDNIDTIRTRLQVYEQQTRPVSDFYKKRGKQVLINGMGSVDDIFGRICACVDAL